MLPLSIYHKGQGVVEHGLLWHQVAIGCAQKWSAELAVLLCWLVYIC